MGMQTSDNRYAVIFVLAGMGVLGLSDNLLRLISTESSLWQFHFLRSTMALACLVVVARFGYGRLWPRRPAAVFARSAMQGLSMLIYFGCLTLMPIGVALAGFFTSPLFVLLIAVIFQGKRVGWVEVAAVIIGFAGALMVIRPDPAALDLVSFLPILAGLLYAIGAVATRAWCEGEGTLTLSAWFFVALLLAGLGGIGLLPAGAAAGAEGFNSRGWMPLSGTSLAWIAAQALGTLIGIACIFRAYVIGEASRVAIFEYSLLVFASIWAWFLWGQGVPALGILGMALIVAAGAVIARRSDP